MRAEAAVESNPRPSAAAPAPARPNRLTLANVFFPLVQFSVALRPWNVRTVRDRGALDGLFDFHTAPELCAELAHTEDCFEAAPTFIWD